jgi:taspase, threonine aspartase, 1
VLPPDFLISPAAKERWRHWRHDLDVARQKEKRDEARMEEERRNEVYRTPIHRPMIIRPSQLISPPPSVNSNPHNDVSFNQDIEGDSPTGLIGDGSNNFRDNIPRKKPPPKMRSIYRSSGQDIGAFNDPNNTNRITSPTFPAVVSSRPRTILDHSCQSHDKVQVDVTCGQAPSNTSRKNTSASRGRTESKDHITDTVGAIAVDCYGNIAAGSSSGGIGMKHRGRIGPAALVGVGTTVIPVDPEDPDRTCVATVTSGTGEHMTTTMAASICASRVYFSQRKGEGGILEEVSEDEAVKAMIEEDFMSTLDLGYRFYISTGD